MSGLRLRSHSLRISAVVAALLFSGAALAQTRLQQIADDAALTAVQVLGSGGEPADAAAAAEQTVSAIPGITAQTTASSDKLSATVTVTGPAGKAPAVSTARYLPPDQPANWTWTSRQRFAFDHAPVVVGSYCWRDCAPVR
jgi:Flp pilus assembly protein TadG